MLIVVVDDDEDLRDALKEVLRAEGHPTLCAANGVEALRVIREAKEPPRLILLDLMMPVMDGWELLKEIDDDPRLHEISVAFMSGHASIRRAFEQNRLDDGSTQLTLRGASRFLLPKPLNLLRLLTLIRELDGEIDPVERIHRRSYTGIAARGPQGQGTEPGLTDPLPSRPARPAR